MSAPVDVRVVYLHAAVRDMLELLHECADTLDNYSDVLDGDYGEPRPNRAMSTLTRVEALLDRIEGRSR